MIVFLPFDAYLQSIGRKVVLPTERYAFNGILLINELLINDAILVRT